MQLEYDKVYNCGTRSLTYFLFKYGWLFFLIAFGILYFTFEMYFGKFRVPVEQFLQKHEDWYITVGMLTEWLILLAISIAFIGYIRSKVLHRKIKFKIDRHAFHLREGLFMIKESVIPYQQISNVHLVRPYFFRILGLARLDVMTVSDKDTLRRSSGLKTGDYLIPLIDTKIARELAKHLMQKAAGTHPGMNRSDSREEEYRSTEYDSSEQEDSDEYLDESEEDEDENENNNGNRNSKEGRMITTEARTIRHIGLDNKDNG